VDQQPTLDIVIIEDDVDASENLRDILELDQHRVTTFPSAAEVFESQRLATADVILLDWKLPDGSALDVLPKLADVAPQADVVIITGYGDFERAVSALREGAADYLLKPINAASLQASIRRLSHRRWLLREKARSDELFRHLVEAAPTLIMILRRDLSVIYFSPYAEQVTGYRASEIENERFAETTFAGVGPEVVRGVVDELFSRGEISGREVEIVRRDGETRWLIWNARILTDWEGEPVILAVGQDVTEQKRSVEKLVQSERLAAIGEAMTGLAHESRNALQRSQAQLELLADELGGQPDQLALVAQIQKAQNHLHQLYEEVRQYAAPLRLEVQTVALEELVLEIWGHLEGARRGRCAKLSFQSRGVAECAADRFMLGQVFRNILENALAACPDPVEIRVSCETTSIRAKCVRIAFVDNGPGLTAEQRQRIFEPFYTTKTRGTGLGMTLSQRIIQAHGGSIRVGDGPGGEIIIELPRAGRGRE
jgi:two-component system, LuxR family, sensor kinase FixL